MRVIRGLVASSVLIALLVGCDAGADDRARTILMDDFESGALADWQSVDSGAGGWLVYDDGHLDLPDPPNGAFAAATDGDGPGTRILYRDVTLEGRFTLHMTVFYEGSAVFSSPDTLAHGAPEPNQQVRIDLMDPSAPIDSIDGDDVLVNAFHTAPGDPVRLPPTEVSVDVSAWAGRTVRIRIAETDNQGPLQVGVDNIRFVAIDEDADDRIELPSTPEPSSSIELVLERLNEEETLEALESWLVEEAAGDRFSGAVLVARDDDVLFHEAYGLADRERAIENTLQTRFRIGSMNKMFTAVATLQLVEDDLIELDAPIGAYVTDYPNQRVAEEVTIHHLLTHTGGTGDIFGPDFDAHREELRTLDDYVEVFGTRGFDFRPGSRWAYSNYGFVLLGVVIERVTGQSYYEYVQTNIYDPAGMTGTASLPEDVRVPDRSIGYTRQLASGEWVPNTDTLPYRGTSAGGGYSTVGDLFRFADALMNDELLSRESTELLITAKVDSGRGAGYAYGFDDRRGADGTGWVGHGGGAPGMNGDLRIYPESGYVVVVLSNLDPPAAQRVSDFLDQRLPIDR